MTEDEIKELRLGIILQWMDYGMTKEEALQLFNEIDAIEVE